MAVIKHIASKNADYGAALDYVMFQHDELSGKAIKDEQGRPIPRESFILDGLNCEAMEYPLAAKLVASRYGKNTRKNEIKSHHYILSFDPRDTSLGLTMSEAHQMALRFAKQQFGGHVGPVCTHPCLLP